MQDDLAQYHVRPTCTFCEEELDMSTCIFCGDEFTNVDMVDITHLPCDHHTCGPCIQHGFATAFTPENPFPLRCCGDAIASTDIPAGAGGITAEDLEGFRLREVELTTPNPTCCSSLICGLFIPATNIADNIATCPQPTCTSRTCTECKEREHPGESCKIDEKLDELVNAQGWKRCRRCRRIVELAEGCHHISKSLALSL